jgi:hypothetical protein
MKIDTIMRAKRSAQLVRDAATEDLSILMRRARIKAVNSQNAVAARMIIDRLVSGTGHEIQLMTIRMRCHWNLLEAFTSTAGVSNRNCPILPIRLKLWPDYRGVSKNRHICLMS